VAVGIGEGFDMDLIEDSGLEPQTVVAIDHFPCSYPAGRLRRQIAAGLTAGSRRSCWILPRHCHDPPENKSSMRSAPLSGNPNSPSGNSNVQARALWGSRLTAIRTTLSLLSVILP